MDGSKAVVRIVPKREDKARNVNGRDGKGSEPTTTVYAKIPLRNLGSVITLPRNMPHNYHEASGKCLPNRNLRCSRR